MFFRLNSKPLFPPHLIIRADSTNFLDHDSYIELQQLIKDMEFEVDRAEVLGRLSSSHVQALRIAVDHCGAISDEMKDFISKRLNSY